jgi:hypothetical protein
VSVFLLCNRKNAEGIGLLKNIVKKSCGLCDNATSTTSTTSASTDSVDELECPQYMFDCDPQNRGSRCSDKVSGSCIYGKCIPKIFVNDGEPDCTNDEDEYLSKKCTTHDDTCGTECTCQNGERCHEGKCKPKDYFFKNNGQITSCSGRAMFECNVDALYYRNKARNFCKYECEENDKKSQCELQIKNLEKQNATITKNGRWSGKDPKRMFVRESMRYQCIDGYRLYNGEGTGVFSKVQITGLDLWCEDGGELKFDVMRDVRMEIKKSGVITDLSDVAMHGNGVDLQCISATQ